MSRKVSFVRESVYGGKRQSKSGNQSELDLTSSGQKSFFLLSEDFFQIDQVLEAFCLFSP